jgi:hypothetical protein
MASQPSTLYDFYPDNVKQYREWIKQNMKAFVEAFILTSDDPERNYKWLMNWIGKDCYDHFIGKKSIPECQKRKDFLLAKYVDQNESLPFYNGEESSKRLQNNEIPFISRLSSTTPGEVTIQWYDDETESNPARRFNPYTGKATDNRFQGQDIQEYIDDIVEKRGPKLKKKKSRQQYKNYYSDVNIQPYETTE